MSHTICTRCCLQALRSLNVSLPLRTFSTTATRSANPPKKKPTTAKPALKAGKTLRLAKNKRVQTSRPPASGERKALRKRVVLSNSNALEVAGLQDLNAETIGTLSDAEGQVLGFTDGTVDALRALEAFKPTQGWSLFRRPASVVRSETVQLGGSIAGIKDSKAVVREIITGEKGTGKSVLLLQGMASAYLQGMAVIHFPEAREATMGQTAYEPVRTPDGQTIYVQPHYTAHLLGNIAKANKGLLDNLRIGQQHNLPVPIQSNISLYRLADMGASDPIIAYPIWQALWRELLAPSRPDQQGLMRPPVFVGMDGVDHIMRVSAYLDTEAKQVHAHDLAIVRDFAELFSGKTDMPNGGAVVAATSASSRPSVPTLDHVIARKLAEPHLQKLHDLKKDLLAACESAKTIEDIDLTSLEDLSARSFPEPLDQMVGFLQNAVLNLHDHGKPVSELKALLERSVKPRLPEWNPFVAIDERVQACLKDVKVRKIEGLSKTEARGVMEYYARSGMMREAITESLVSEKWTMSGHGVVGLLEHATVAGRFKAVDKPKTNVAAV